MVELIQLYLNFSVVFIFCFNIKYYILETKHAFHNICFFSCLKFEGLLRHFHFYILSHILAYQRCSLEIDFAQVNTCLIPGLEVNVIYTFVMAFLEVFGWWHCVANYEEITTKMEYYKITAVWFDNYSLFKIAPQKHFHLINENCVAHKIHVLWDNQ